MRITIRDVKRDTRMNAAHNHYALSYARFMLNDPVYLTDSRDYRAWLHYAVLAFDIADSHGIVCG